VIAALQIVATREDVAAEAARQGWNLEDAARRLRYAFFERVCAAGQATRIAVAHTAQDQAETVLAHLIRGTGPTGLAGIYPTAGSVIRPLLATARLDLREYLSAKNQAWREDATNRDTPPASRAHSRATSSGSGARFRANDRHPPGGTRSSRWRAGTVLVRIRRRPLPRLLSGVADDAVSIRIQICCRLSNSPPCRITFRGLHLTPAKPRLYVRSRNA